ncbi:MAG: hypothetical protein Q8R16_03945 [bacterium]|nr:hypothetical protein [bacterium]
MPALPSQPPAATSTPRPAGPQALRPSGGSPSGKRKIVDVRPPRPRLIGPIEELETLTVEDFRKIRGTPAEVAQRIAQKLDILEKQSYVQRATGLRALRASPLMTAYADILNTALAEGKKVDDVIAAAGTLTKEEFSALREMSSTIRT